MMTLVCLLPVEETDERDCAVFGCECGYDEVYELSPDETVPHAEAAYASRVCPMCGRYGEVE